MDFFAKIDKKLGKKKENEFTDEEFLFMNHVKGIDDIKTDKDWKLIIKMRKLFINLKILNFEGSSIKKLRKRDL
jgi:hypothetical protein